MIYYFEKKSMKILIINIKNISVLSTIFDLKSSQDNTKQDYSKFNVPTINVVTD